MCGFHTGAAHPASWLAESQTSAIAGYILASSGMSWTISFGSKA